MHSSLCTQANSPSRKLKSLEANYSLIVPTLPLDLIGNFVVGEIWKLLAAAFTKEADTLLINLFTISIMEYYTICVTTLKI